MALLLLGAIFLFFLFLVFATVSLFRDGSSLSLGEKVGVVEILGEIGSSREIVDELLEFKRDDSVRALVLRVDSPGGGVAPSQEIFEEIKKLTEIKPVVVSMGSMAASGGYYIAVAGSKILASPGTITGSIGVIMEFTNFKDLLDRVGLKNEVIKSGRLKDIGSSIRAMSDEERNLLQEMMNDVHSQFVGAVAQSRNLPEKFVFDLADGRIFTGRKALELGLVDELGNMQDAVSAAAVLAGIEGEPRLVYPEQEKPPFINYLLEQSVSQLKNELQLTSRGGLRFMWSGLKQEAVK